MLLVILLAISILSQFFAAVVSIRLTKTTKYNAAWILITIALTLTCVLMMGQFLKVLNRFTDRQIEIELHENVAIWISVTVSLCFAVGVFLIRKVLKYIAFREELRRKSEERILSAVIQAEEAQRQLFAKELHDGLGPLLSTAKLSISALAGQQSEGNSKEIIQNAEQAINLSIRSVKDISNNLSPHILNNFGVVRAINSFLNRVRPVVESKILFDTNIRNERFTPNSEIVVYRAACELINNALKHAHAKLIIISLQYMHGEMVMDVKDDGRGFDTETQSEGMGLSNISSRVRSVKGNIQIKSEVGVGTHITIIIPIRTIN